jgi:colicin import membrane protein
VQELPQAPVERPDTVDQERITRLAQEQADKKALEEQQLRQRQEQVDLTEDIARQQEIERRQRLRELAELTREREAATRRTKLEEQRMQQLADMQSAKPTPAPRAAASPPAGDRGLDEGLLAKYKSAMNQTADANWTHIGASELVNCEVRFTQIPGGLVRTVEFLNCPFGAEGREFVTVPLARKAGSSSNAH